MSATDTQQMSGQGALAAVVRARRLIERLAQPWFVQLALRVALAVPFWKSGILKWQGFLQLNDTAITLFTDEFRLHLPGGPYPFPAPAVFAFLSGCGEVMFPVLIVLGIGTRFAAVGLLGASTSFVAWASSAVPRYTDFQDDLFRLKVAWADLHTSALPVATSKRVEDLGPLSRQRGPVSASGPTRSSLKSTRFCLTGKVIGFASGSCDSHKIYYGISSCAAHPQ